MLENIKAVLFRSGRHTGRLHVGLEAIDLDYLGKRHLQMPKSLQKDIEGMSMRGDRLLFFKNSLASQMILIP